MKEWVLEFGVVAIRWQICSFGWCFFYFHNAQLGIRSQIFHPFFYTPLHMNRMWKPCYRLSCKHFACSVTRLSTPNGMIFFSFFFLSLYWQSRIQSLMMLNDDNKQKKKKKKRQWKKKGKRSWESLINNNMRFSVVHSIPIKLEYKCAETWCFCGDADGMREQRNVHSVWRSCVSSGVT